MASSTQSGFVVVTPMYPQQSGPTAPAFGTTPHVSSALGNFLKGNTKALGTVQIMIGVLDIFFGILMAISAERIRVILVVFCGGLIYISSGALSVAANNKLNKCLVNGALGMNIISTITAGIAIILFSLEIVFVVEYSGYFCYSSNESYYDNSCEQLQHMLEAMLGVLLVFSILEFIISIYVSAFACRAVCDCSTEQVVYMPPTSNQVASENLLIPAPNVCKMTVSPILGQSVMGSMQTEMPPIYEEVLP